MIGNPSTGWLGIDLGCDSIKMAQVRRQGRAFELIDAVAVPRSQNNWCNQKKSELSSSKDELLGGLSLGNGFRRGRASATVSPSISDVHIIEAAEDDPVRIHRALIETGISLDDCQVDSWPANYESEKKGTRTTAPFGVVSMPTSWCDAIVNDIQNVGLLCQSLDGSPTALARAADLASPTTPDTPVGMLDIGRSHALFVATHRGRALYARKLKCPGFGHILENAATKLGQNDRVTWNFLIEHDLTKVLSSNNIMSDVIGQFISQLVQENERTLRYLQTYRGAVKPNQIYLTGGGALIRGLAEQLTKDIGFAVESWYPDSKQLRVPASKLSTMPLYGAAISQSLLAWER